jgi:hypothetical protein
MILCAMLAAGCGQEHAEVPQAAPVDWFAPVQMRIHPIFTQISSWNHGPKPDGIEAQLEFTDQFNDPTKASGSILFELFDYVKESPDHRGKRKGYWVGSLATLDEQRARWNTTLRTYRFQLVYPAISPDLPYLLTATFEKTGGGRFPVSSIVLPGHKPGPKKRAENPRIEDGG